MSLSVVLGLGVEIGLTTSEAEDGAATNSTVGSSDRFKSFAASWSMLSICKSLEVTFSNEKLLVF